jgi:hypothetical protein
MGIRLCWISHRVLLRRRASRLRQGFVIAPLFYARLLMPVAGAVSLMVGRFASSTSAESLLLSFVACGSGVGSVVLEHLLGGR